MHLIHGCVDEGLDYTCPQHEQAAGFAADAYARLKGLGCAIATSGPGASNLITPIIASFYDSIPVLYLVGNVTTFRMAESFPSPPERGYGFQELPFTRMIRPVVKYAECVMRPDLVLPALHYALAVAREGRPGPVVIDVPDDVQRAEI